MIDARLHAELLPGFAQQRVALDDNVEIAVSLAGSGRSVLLLHGHPQTRLTWSFVAPRLVAAGYAVVAADLRGYGDSTRTEGGPRHVNYAKRTMAADQVAVMRALGHERFAVVGHDRGGRVAHRMALDHPERVERVALLDICPTATMYALTTREFATRYFWWFFLIQPFDLPERLIAADPAYFLDKHLIGQRKASGAADPRLRAEYLRCYLAPGTIHAICEDYRAAASLDLEHDAADSHLRVTCPLLALWGDKGTVGQLFDVIGTWREKATNVQGRALGCGHTLQEEVPDDLFAALREFLAASPYG